MLSKQEALNSLFLQKWRYGGVLHQTSLAEDAHVMQWKARKLTLNGAQD